MKSYHQLILEFTLPTEKDKARKLNGIPEPGEIPIPDGHVRLYHQTKEHNLEHIRKHGIQMSHARGIEGPKAIWADEKGFYGHPSEKPTVEFHIPKSDWNGQGHIHRSIEPHEIVATHHPWHSKARYLVRHPDVHKNLMQGKLDKLTDDYKTAGEYVKKHHPVLD